MASKNKAVAGHKVDLLLGCGCIVQEPVEAAIYLPNTGEPRTCKKHGPTVILKVGTMYWEDES